MRLDGGHHPAVVVGVGALDRGPGLRFLRLVLGEDRRAILGADVIALAVELGRVVDREEDVEQVAIADLVGIEGDADRLGMAGVAAAYLLVGRIGGLPAGIAAVTDLTPITSRNTASMHQKHPPARIATCSAMAPLLSMC